VKAWTASARRVNVNRPTLNELLERISPHRVEQPIARWESPTRARQSRCSGQTVADHGRGPGLTITAYRAAGRGLAVGAQLSGGRMAGVRFIADRKSAAADIAAGTSRPRIVQIRLCSPAYLLPPELASRGEPGAAHAWARADDRR
jgi:hypothetical protein